MYKTVFKENNELGMYYFISPKPFKNGKKQAGFGKIRYPEGSVYEGDLLYNGDFFGKMGFGEQEFTHSVVESGAFGAPSDLKLFKFIGYFDCKKCDWMWGNGIVYFNDANGNPKAFIKGFFNRTKKVKEWKGEFSQKDLLEGFTLDMEIEQNLILDFCGMAQKYKQEFENVKECDFLVFGDSWTEIWRNTERDQGGSFYPQMEKYASGVSYVNVGIGGTKYCDWFDFIYDIVIPKNPKKIFINLGFNDLHASLGINQTFKDFVKIVTKLKKALPDTKIYIASVCHMSNYKKQWKEENAFNAKIKPYCDANGLVYLDTVSLFEKDGKVFDDIDDYSMQDKIHLNLKGYEIWGKYVLESIFKK